MKHLSLALLLGVLGCVGDRVQDTGSDTDTGDADCDGIPNNEDLEVFPNGCGDDDCDDIPNSVDGVNDDKCGTQTEDWGDTFNEATPLEWDENGSILARNSIEAAGDRDFVSVVLEEGQTVLVGAYTDEVDADGKGAGTPDMVILVHAPDGTFVGENDDQPHRMGGTDAGFVFRAYTDGEYRIELREWSDWDPESTGTEGGPDYLFTLEAIRLGYTLERNEDILNDAGRDNDTVGDAIANRDATPDPAYDFYTNWWSEDYPLSFTVADIHEAGDVDYLFLRFDDATFCQYSIWPGVATDGDIRFSVVDEAGNVLASRDDPFAVSNTLLNVGLYQSGITMPVFRASELFLQVEDYNGGGGYRNWYSVHTVCYLPDNFTYEVETFTENPLQSTAVTMNAGTNGRFGRILGNLENDDVMDSWKIGASEFGGTKYLHLYFDTASTGTELKDAIVTVYDADGATVLTSFSAPSADEDPVLENFEVTTGGDKYVVVTSLSGEQGPGAYYMAFAYVTGAPL